MTVWDKHRYSILPPTNGQSSAHHMESTCSIIFPSQIDLLCVSITPALKCIFQPRCLLPLDSSVSPFYCGTSQASLNWLVSFSLHWQTQTKTSQLRVRLPNQVQKKPRGDVPHRSGKVSLLMRQPASWQYGEKTFAFVFLRWIVANLLARLWKISVASSVGSPTAWVHGPGDMVAVLLKPIRPWHWYDIHGISYKQS